MKEKPIIFKDWEVRAVKENRKSQFRRIVKPQSAILTDALARALGVRPPEKENEPVIRPPYGQPGDRLWVRETWMPFEVRGSAGFGPKVEIGYKATNDIRPDGVSPLDFGASLLFDCTDVEWEKFRNIIEKMDAEGDKWLSPVSMPRWASRITLEVTRVRVERLQEISEEDAKAEGFGDPEGLNRNYADRARYWFRNLWESINGPESWAANPWVWVYNFKKV